MSKYRQLIHLYICVGFIFSLVIWFIPFYTMIERTILFAAFVVVPFSWLRVVRTHGKEEEIFVYLLPFTSLFLAVSFMLETGMPAGVLALPWVVVTFVIAWRGLTHLLQVSSFPEVAKATGFLYLSIGGIWIMAHQFAMPLVGFEGEIMLLTANHFHYAGLVVPILLAEIYGYKKLSIIGKVVLVAGMTAPILVALGIAYSPLLEWVAVLILASIMMSYTLCIFKDVILTTRKWSRVCHVLSAGVIPVTMVLAIVYGFGEWMDRELISIDQMVIFHGIVNAVLFSFFGLLGWQLIEQEEHLRHIPFSNVQGRGRIGADIFHRGAITDKKDSPKGLIDRIDEYRSSDFDPSSLPKEVINFYEHTDTYEMLLKPYWKKGFRILAIIYKFIAAKVEQMNFPLKEESDATLVESRILSIKDELDGRSRVRAWVRTYRKTGKAIYAALYSTHISEGTRYMNIAFPLPYFQMTSILRLHNHEGRSLSLTSWQEGEKEDQGVYLVRNGSAIRLPINETITVWKNEEERIQARHDMWVFGINFLTLYYDIFETELL